MARPKKTLQDDKPAVAPRRGRKGGKQLPLSDDMVPEQIPEIVEAAEMYEDVRDRRCALSKEESEKKQNLIRVMQKHGREIYASPDGLEITISDQLNVKVKRPKHDYDPDEFED